MPSPKPHVQIACVCEKVLLETDAVPSLVRVVDTYTVDLPGQVPAGFKFATQLTAFVALKSGEVVGRFDVGLRLTQPDGKMHLANKWTAEFKGQEMGVNIRLEFSIQDPKEGLYWFDVLWGEDSEVLTRIPFRLRVRQAAVSNAEVAANVPN